MPALNTIFVCLNYVFILFLIYFAFVSYQEGKRRAILLSLIGILLINSLIMFSVYIPEIARLVYILLIATSICLYFLPVGNMKSIAIKEIKDKVDERDVVFSREEYDYGSDKYDNYYATYPEKKDVDDKMRRLPKILEPGGKYYNDRDATIIGNIFGAIESMLESVDGPVSEIKSEIDIDDISSELKKMTIGMGADDVGICTLNPAFVYSHVGRGPEKWGEPIVNDHKYAIMFALEMQYENVEQAPYCGITYESAFQYLRMANISIALAKYIRSLGYRARAHIAGSNYQIMMPPVAHDAGLGELGRIGYLIHPQYGARVRIGGVTTDLPLNCNEPISFGVQDFCNICKKCATNCPSAAIPKGNKELVRGVEKWPLNIERCIHFWRKIGTDCGLCMKICPYSHPPTLAHNLVRSGIKKSKFAQRVSLWGDDLFYGQKSRIKSNSK